MLLSFSCRVSDITDKTCWNGPMGPRPVGILLWLRLWCCLLILNLPRNPSESMGTNTGGPLWPVAKYFWVCFLRNWFHWAKAPKVGECPYLYTIPHRNAFFSYCRIQKSWSPEFNWSVPRIGVWLHKAHHPNSCTRYTELFILIRMNCNA